MKYAYSLNARLPSSPVFVINWRFPNKCPIRKVIRKRPVRAIQYFFASEDVNIPDLLIVFLKNVSNDTNLIARTTQTKLCSYLETI